MHNDINMILTVQRSNHYTTNNTHDKGRFTGQTREKDPLLRKRNFVRSLTRSMNYLNDDDFLKPIGRKENEETRRTRQPSYSKQSTLSFDKGTKEKKSLLVRAKYICERCAHAIAKAKGTDDYQLVLCATHIQAFPTDRACTAFKLDEFEKE